MASMINTVYLSEIHPFKNVWRVDVKVLHKWITLSHQYGASIEMVLSDQNVSFSILIRNLIHSIILNFHYMLLHYFVLIEFHHLVIFLRM